MANFNPIDLDYIVRWRSDLENTKEIPLHKPSQDQSKSTALGGVWSFAERCIITCTDSDKYRDQSMFENIVKELFAFRVMKNWALSN